MPSKVKASSNIRQCSESSPNPAARYSHEANKQPERGRPTNIMKEEDLVFLTVGRTVRPEREIVQGAELVY